MGYSSRTRAFPSILVAILLLLVTGFLNWKYTQAKAGQEAQGNGTSNQQPDDGITTTSTFSVPRR